MKQICVHKLINFLISTYRIDTRTVKFLQKFQFSDNHIHYIFEERKVCVKKFFSQYESDPQ